MTIHLKQPEFPQTAQQLRELLTTGRTLRYHTHSRVMLTQQDVAQHTYNVLWLMVALTGGRVPGVVLLAALAHDAGERWTGDIPGDVKRSLELGEQFDAFERSVLKERCGLELTGISGEWQRLLKLCDALEGYRLCAEELGRGNEAMRGVYRNFYEFVISADNALTHSDRDVVMLNEPLLLGFISALDEEANRARK